MPSFNNCAVIHLNVYVLARFIMPRFFMYKYTSSPLCGD